MNFTYPKYPVLQPKLTIGQSNAPYEQEADAIADQVMQMPQSPPPIQRKCEDSEEEQLQMKPLADSITPIIQKQSEEEEEELQMKGFDSGVIQTKTTEVSSDISSQLNHTKGGGSKLSESTNQFMSNAFGADFSGVNIHTDANAVQMNRSLNARAFTHGSDIYFNRGEYSPESSGGKHLLAHELTHVVQQNQGARKIQKETLEERADRENNAGYFQLRNALDDSIQDYRTFNFEHDFESGFMIDVREGGNLWIVIESTSASATATNFTVELYHSEFGSDTNVGSRSYAVGRKVTHSWRSLPAGEYYMRFVQTHGVMISGNVWIDVFSGMGERPDLSQANDRLEDSYGISTTGNTFAGVAYGQFVLRSEPVPNSFIFGTLPGVPTRVRVLDKRSFNRDGSDSWYLIQFRDEEIFNSIATERPPENNSHAMTMYAGKKAWVIAKALKIYISYAQLLAQLRRFERGRTDSLRDRITYLRQMHQDPRLPYDDMIGTHAGSYTADNRSDFSNLIQMLKDSVTGVVLPDGSYLDFAHFLIAMDAYLHPDSDFTMNFSVVPNQPMGGSRAALGWSGDVGAAIGDYVIDHEDNNLSNLDSTLLDVHFQKSAPDADLLGNLDGIGASNLIFRSAATTLEGLVRLYYEGVSTAQPTGNTNAFSSNRSNGLTSFLSSYGFSGFPLWSSTNRPAIICLARDAYLLGNVWYKFGRKSIGATFSPPKSLLTRVTFQMLVKFTDRLEQFANTYQVTSIPVSTSPAAGCTIPTSALTNGGGGDAVPQENEVEPSTDGSENIIRRKSETSIPKAVKKIQRASIAAPMAIKQSTHGTSMIQKQDNEDSEQLSSIIFRSIPTLNRIYAEDANFLSEGSTDGAAVTAIQQTLLFLEYDLGARPDGDFGTTTARLIRQFQNDLGISPASGSINMRTLRTLDRLAYEEESDANDSAVSSVGIKPTTFATYPRTYISSIDVDLSNGAVTLTWAGPNARSRDTGPFTGSSGLGITSGSCNDCNDVAESNRSGSNCTPKGSFTVSQTAASLGAFPEALFATYFMGRGVAFHYYPSVPGHPASHGCVRLNLYPAMLINHNVKTNDTTVNVGGTWSRGWYDRGVCDLNEARIVVGDLYDDAVGVVGEIYDDTVEGVGELYDHTIEGAGDVLEGMGNAWDSIWE